MDEATSIIKNLQAYGMIHAVEGVSYTAGTHKEFINKADEWLNKYKSN